METKLQLINFNIFLEQLRASLETSLSKDAQNEMMPIGRQMDINPNKPIGQSAVLILLFPYNNSIYFPLIRRAKYIGEHSQQMALPGGKLEKTDQSLIHTALRETCEEIGVCIPDINILGVLSELIITFTNMKILPVVAAIEKKPNFTINPNEVDNLFMVNIKDLDNKNKMCKNRNLRGDNIEIPFYHLNRQEVWGATAMILSELEHVIKS